PRAGLRLRAASRNRGAGPAQRTSGPVSVFISGFISFDVFHRCAGKHSLSSADIAAVRPDVNGSHGPARSRVQSYDPDRIATRIVTQGVIHFREMRTRFIRGITGYRVG